MRLTRLPLLTIAIFFVAGPGFAQNLPDVVRKAVTPAANTQHARRVITNDDIPPVKVADQQSTQALPAQAQPAETPAAENPETVELCRYVTALRTELQQLDRRVQKLQQQIEKTESDMLRQVYANALLRLNETQIAKQQELQEALSTPEGASCRPLPGTAPGATAAGDTAESH